MISIGKMSASYRATKEILSRFNIEFEENYDKFFKNFAENTYSAEFKKQSLIGSSIDIYNTAIDNKDFNLYLPEDGAFFQFSYGAKNLRYAYFERPHDAMTYRQFLLDLGFSYDEVGDELYEDFNQYLVENPQKEHITNVRYDYSEGEYREVVHPVSHLHIGQQNNIRIPLSKILLPENFVMFVIKQVYWEKFKVESEKNDDMITYYLNKIALKEDLNSEYFTSNDSKDLTLR